MTDGTNVLLCERPAEGVALLTLNRPDKKNALSEQLRNEISRNLLELAQDDSVKGVVLTGAGGAFCAGFDLAELAVGNAEEIFAEARAYHFDVYNFAKPLLAAINGPALAGGMDLAAMCDIRIASQSATFGQPQVRMGIPAAYDLIRTVVPETLARHLCLTGERIAAQAALDAGFVIDVVDPADLLSRAVEIAGQIAESSGGAGTKKSITEHQPSLFGEISSG
jgi:enoyl-CoA hydratase